MARAWQVKEPGGVFHEIEIAPPSLGPNELLVRVSASGVNPLDTKIRAGKAAHAQQPLPAVLGVDMAGTVDEVGSGVTAFKSGDEVYGMAGGVGGLQGTLADVVVADADLLALKPRNLSMRQAAALPLSVITAWEGLVDRAKVHADQTVLVHGGAGGVGHIAVQVARLRRQGLRNGLCGKEGDCRRLRRRADRLSLDHSRRVRGQLYGRQRIRYRLRHGRRRNA